MVMDLLGPSLEDLFNMCDRNFTLKTIVRGLARAARRDFGPGALESERVNSTPHPNLRPIHQVKIMGQLLLRVEFLHGRNFIHRDVRS